MHKRGICTHVASHGMYFSVPDLASPSCLSRRSHLPILSRVDCVGPPPRGDMTAAAPTADSERRVTQANQIDGSGAHTLPHQRDDDHPLPPSPPLRFPSASLSSSSALLSLVSVARPQLDELRRQSAAAAAAVADEAGGRTEPAAGEQVPYAALYIDCSWKDLLFAYRSCLLTTETAEARRRLQDDIAALFRRRHNVRNDSGGVLSSSSPAPPVAPLPSPLVPSPSQLNVNSHLPASFVSPAYRLSEHNIFTALSARTCFDLYLSARAFPSGSYVLLSAINIPDMSIVLRAHQLVPVPIDIHPATLQPDLELLEQVAAKGIKGQKVVAMLIAHLYGRRFDMAGVAAIAQRHRIEVRSIRSNSASRGGGTFFCV